jgi:hypothetical protein
MNMRLDRQWGTGPSVINGPGISTNTDWANPGYIGSGTPNNANFVNISTENVNLQDGNIFSTVLVTSTTTINQVVDSWSYLSYHSAKYDIQILSGGDFQSTTIEVVHDGVSVYLTEYGGMSTDNTNLASFDADIYNGNLRLLVTPTNPLSTIKVVRETI